MEKTFEMIIDNEATDGVYAISLVDRPAIEEDFILLSKEDRIIVDIKLAKNDTIRKVVTGPILIPDKVIPRNGYNIVFSKDTVRKLSENYIIDGKKDNVTLQHSVSVNKVYMIESWIVEDTEMDKSAKLGLSLPVGTWCGSFKVLDDGLWTEYIESGILKGFSLEGNFGKKEVKMGSCGHYHELDEPLDEDLHNLYLAINFTPADLDKYYVWKLGNVDGKLNCPICEKNNGKVFTLRQWLSIGIPRVKNGTKIAGELTKYQTDPFATYCELNCNCELVPVSQEVKRRVINPFKK